MQTTALLCRVHKVSLWTRALSPGEVSATWRHSRLAAPPGLALGWTLHAGAGLLVTDTVRSHRLTLSSAGASWVHVSVTDDVNVRVVTSLTSPRYLSAVSACGALFGLGAIGRPCGELSAARTFFQAACVRDAVDGRGADWSMSAVLTFASQCQAVTGVGSWPGRTLCHAFPSRHFPEFSGPSCDRRCVFGRPDPDTEACACREGFWGQACDERCPAGDAGQAACSGHGKCDQTAGRSVPLISFSRNRRCSEKTRE